MGARLHLITFPKEWGLLEVGTFSKQEAMKLSQHLDKIKKMIKELVAVRVKMIDRDQ